MDGDPRHEPTQTGAEESSAPGNTPEGLAGELRSIENEVDRTPTFVGSGDGSQLNPDLLYLAAREAGVLRRLRRAIALPLGSGRRTPQA